MSGSTTARALHDRIGDGYTLLRLGGAQADAAALAQAFAALARRLQCSISPSTAARYLWL